MTDYGWDLPPGVGLDDIEGPEPERPERPEATCICCDRRIDRPGLCDECKEKAWK